MPNESFIVELVNFFVGHQELLTLYVNSLLILLTGTVGIIYSSRWLNGYLNGFTRVITGGIALTATGIFINKILWLIENGGETFAKNALIYNNIGLFSFIPITLIIIGYLLHLSPYLKECIKEQWMLKTTGGFVLIFFLIIFVQSLVK